MQKGRLFVIDGLDGTGKSTQLPLVSAALAEGGVPNQIISFPQHGAPSAALVDLYLEGAFGGDPRQVNPYAVSSFYAVDRFASYQQHWGAAYRSGAVLLSARYVGSNAMYQMSKLPQSEWDAYLAWLADYEYGKLALPRPDRVVLLDMPPEASQRLLSERYEGDEQKKDIHEQDRAYLAQCRAAARYAAEKEHWQVLSCTDGERLYTKAEMTQRILDALQIIA